MFFDYYLIIKLIILEYVFLLINIKVYLIKFLLMIYLISNLKRY